VDTPADLGAVPVATAAARRRRGRDAALLALPALVVIVMFVAAMAAVVVLSFSVEGGRWGLRHYVRLATDPLYGDYLWRSFRVSLYCTPITLLLGYPVAYVMARATGAVRMALLLLLVVQFFTSYVIRAYALILVLGNNGIVNRALLALGAIDRPLTLLYNELGVAVSLVLIALPFMVFPIYSVLRNVEPNLETAASSLGADPRRVFWHVIFPLSVPGVLAGAVLVFLFNLTAYIMPGLLGGGYFDMAANVIYDQAMEVRDRGFASAMSIALLLATLLVVYLTNRWGARLSAWTEE
jgi:putative spermidine/putrescine transport system permease protein